MSNYVNDMTNEEIWEMLKPKMEKNGIDVNGNYYNTWCRVYSWKTIQKAIAIAYRSGYERAMKGRPFKFGEKKKKSGHWEPVDPNNLPKEGTKVRYSRQCDAYSNCKNSIIAIGDLGKIDIVEDGWFGIAPDNPRSSFMWLSFHDDGIASCLDMWVEDDE